MQIKGYLEIALVNLTFLAAMNINLVTLNIILIQITFIMIYMSIVDIMTMSSKKNIKPVEAFLSYILLYNIYKIMEYLQCLSFNFDVIALSETYIYI